MPREENSLYTQAMAVTHHTAEKNHPMRGRFQPETNSPSFRKDSDFSVRNVTIRIERIEAFGCAVMISLPNGEPLGIPYISGKPAAYWNEMPEKMNAIGLLFDKPDGELLCALAIEDSHGVVTLHNYPNLVAIERGLLYAVRSILGRLMGETNQ